MSSLLNIGVSGLNAAQLGLKVTGNNIANAGTDGYSRQSTVQVDQVGQNNGRYTMGTGVDVVAVQRAYSQYLTQALWNSNSALQGATTTNDLATALNGLLQNSGNLQSALDSFYGGFNAVANAPSDPSARQALLGNAQALVMAFADVFMFLTTGCIIAIALALLAKPAPAIPQAPPGGGAR